MSHDKLVGAIDAYTTKAQALDGELHELAVQTLLHANYREDGGHEDARLADRLIRGLGRSQNAKGLRFWFETFSPIRWNGDGNVGILKKDSKKYVPFKIEEAMANPFWDMEEVKADQEKNLKKFSIYDIYRFLDGLPERIKKMHEEGRFDGDPYLAMEQVGRFSSVVRAEDPTSTKYKGLAPVPGKPATATATPPVADGTQKLEPETAPKAGTRAAREPGAARQ
jgi:hypothetical protein